MTARRLRGLRRSWPAGWRAKASESPKRQCAALIFDALPEVNWAGFYFLKGDELIVRPLSGQTGRRAHCLRSRPCAHGGGATRTLVVPDVHQSPAISLRCGVALRRSWCADRGGTLLGRNSISTARAAPASMSRRPRPRVAPGIDRAEHRESSGRASANDCGALSPEGSRRQTAAFTIWGLFPGLSAPLERRAAIQ